MLRPIPPKVLAKVRKLAQLVQDVRQNPFAVPVTRLTVLKSLCQEPAVANRFALYLASKTLEAVRQGKRRSGRPEKATDQAHQALMAEALAAMTAWLRRPTEALREDLRQLLWSLRSEQDTYTNVAWGAVRNITDWELLLVEYALECLLRPAEEAGHWAYQLARHYAERYDSRRGTGLIPASVPSIQDIVDFWMQELDLDAEALRTPTKRDSAEATKPAIRRPRQRATDERAPVSFTHRQGQFLAFIHLYHKLHRRAPAEADMAVYFRVTPPAVHGMVVKLEELSLVHREPGVPRSLQVALPEAEIPELEEVEGPPW
jgi:hypothetical protein